jgi:hypothetical protein
MVPYSQRPSSKCRRRQCLRFVPSSCLDIIATVLEDKLDTLNQARDSRSILLVPLNGDDNLSEGSDEMSLVGPEGCKLPGLGLVARRARANAGLVALIAD